MLKILTIAILLSSCAVSRQTAKPEVKYFKVVRVDEKTFVAESGKLRATFFKVDCDSVFVGKSITVSRANFIR